jgi:UDP:flavonoid glycosyltransferase YjiC (YdhE family)
VCIAQGHEQPLNAARVQDCGAGVSLPTDAGPQGIADAITAVLEQQAYKRSAVSMSRLIERHGAGASAAEHVEALIPASTGRAHR